MQALDKSFMFIKSALHSKSSFHSIEEVKKWVTLQNAKGKIKALPFLGSFYRIHYGGVGQLDKQEKFKHPIRCIKQ